MVAPVIPIIGGLLGRAFMAVAPRIGSFFAGTPLRAATTIGTSIALDGASGTDVTKPIRQIAPEPVESALDGIHSAGRMSRDFAETASKTIETTKNMLGGTDKGLLAGGAMFLGSLFMEPGMLKTIMELGALAFLLDLGARWFTGKGLATHFNSAVESFSPEKSPAQTQGTAPAPAPM